MKIEIFAAIFLWFLKQQVNLQLFFLRLTLMKVGLTDLPSHYEKLKVNMNLVAG